MRTSPVSFWFNFTPNLCKTTYINIKLDRLSKLILWLKILLLFPSNDGLVATWLPGWLWPEVDQAQQSGWRKKIKYISSNCFLAGYDRKLTFLLLALEEAGGGIFEGWNPSIFVLEPYINFKIPHLTPKICHSAGVGVSPNFFGLESFFFC